MKTPVALEQDDIGRTVKAVFESSPAPVVDAGEAWLVAVDGSPQSLHALDAAVRLASGARVALTLITVVSWESVEASAELPAQGYAHLSEAIARLEAAGLPWRAVVVMGEPAAAINAQAVALGASAIVIGSHGRGAVQAMVMGSVALEVLHSAKVSVWVVRTPAA